MKLNQNFEYNQTLPISVTENDAKQFYLKPETQKEMAKNLEVLRKIPEDISNPKVVIKLGDPTTPHKFITMVDKDGRDYVVAMPIDKKAYHKDILSLATKLYKKEFFNVKGGYISSEGNSLVISGFSKDFGKADHSKVAKILQDKFPNQAIIISERESEISELELANKLLQAAEEYRKGNLQTSPNGSIIE